LVKIQWGIQALVISITLNPLLERFCSWHNEP